MLTSANLTFLFAELPIMARFAAARAAGFDGVEILFPYDLHIPKVAAALRREGLAFTLLNTPPPDWSGGPRGFAALPGMEARFRADFTRTLAVAQALGARHIHIMSGSAAGAKARETLLRNLDWAAQRAPHASLVLEPFGPAHLPGYFLDSYEVAAEVIAAVGAPNLGLILDTHHAQMLTGDLRGCWARYGALVRHVQLAGCRPARHEPDDGSIPLTAFLADLRASGYAGWLAAEYAPAAGTQAGLGWLRDHVAAPVGARAAPC